MVVLCIDDDPEDIEFFTEAIKTIDPAITCLSVAEGEDALNLLNTIQDARKLPDFIFLDINMPRIDGLTVLKALKTHPEFRDIPIVVLTTSKEDRDISKAYELGANSYIVKPVDFDNFMDVAQQIELYWCVYNKLLK